MGQHLGHGSYGIANGTAIKAILSGQKPRRSRWRSRTAGASRSQACAPAPAHAPAQAYAHTHAHAYIRAVYSCLRFVVFIAQTLSLGTENQLCRNA